MEEMEEDGGASAFETVATPQEGAEREAERKAKAEEQRRRAEKVLLRIPTELLKADADVDKCSVCLEPMQAGSTIRRLPCAHIFHADCIAEWFQHSLTCP